MDYDEVLGSVYNPAWQALDPPHRCQRTLDALKHLLLREIGQAPRGPSEPSWPHATTWNLNLS